MAPRTRNDKKHRASRKREVQFPRREIPPRKSATVIRPPQTYENLILYYLTKLKRLFSNTDHPQKGVRENSADKMRRENLGEPKSKTSGLKIDHNKYSASHSAPKPHEDDRDSVDGAIKDKVFNVVNAAIEYGFANDVLERKGDCFVFKSKRYSKIANRQPTPGPSAIKRSYCAQCNCKNCKSYIASDNNFRDRQPSRPMSENNPSRSYTSGSLHESKTQHTIGLTDGRPSHSLQDKRSSRSKSCTLGAGEKSKHSNHFKFRSRLRKMCPCSKCVALEQRRKIRRK